ncbi:hypothetical protein CSC70_02790 [Pseudoxanthomonas kalamensis DSM 18571]|uniref:hypothetical protein n=1 Tax=Pseudoxanthomonas kalamensis TaxID=289483 RepID=UPI0013912853|nr:hypothetical protein [Pseudoxanthomonas kalamensis]KAF1712462.1 hypothetical protein CSC70_02790 [Pseudoxanthomonas kalamensis DSM 18571]
MSAAPPPLPQSAPRPAATGSGFVTVLAWFAIAAALLGLVSGVSQTVSGLFLPADFYARMMDPSGAMELPATLRWFYEHNLMIGLVSLAVSSLLLWVSWALLKRREWGRKAFIALLVLGTLYQLSWVWLMPKLVEGMLTMQAGMLSPGQAVPAELEGFLSIVMWMSALVVLVFVVLHAWLVWKLCTPAIRAEFSSRPN